MSLFLSVIVPSYNRLAQLQKLVLWMQAQGIDRKHSEIIIVNDGSSDGSKEFLDQLTDPWIRALHQENQGQAKARGTGVDSAIGDLLLFLDDDMEPSNPNFLEAHQKFHQLTNVDTVALGAILPPRENSSRPAFEKFYERSIANMYEGFKSGRQQPSGLHFFSANVSLSKNLYLKSGGFDINFRQAEDRELGLRLEFEHDAQFAFVERAAAYHHSPTGRYRAFLDRAYLYGRYDLKIAKSFPEHDELSPYQIFANPPLSKMVLAKCSWTTPNFMRLWNQPLIHMAKISQFLGLSKLAIQCCSVLYCINYVLGLKDEHTYDI
ncbi:MAG: glycosyltransferase [Proteobacteria bacterium]|nr:MAG: glycosyltransferase [Pseudomonadota bacterium]